MNYEQAKRKYLYGVNEATSEKAMKLLKAKLEEFEQKRKNFQTFEKY